MIYLIIGMLILLFYLFALPSSIKGTLNALTLVLLSVIFLILLTLAAFQIFRLPAEIIVGLVMMIPAYLALRDISRLSSKPRLRDYLKDKKEIK